MDHFLSTCQRAARSGGQVLLDWVGRFQAREKAPADLVTEADFASQALIRDILLGEFPDHAFVGEEGPPLGRVDAEYRWLVDPLDGTTNYVHQIPHYCVSIALQRAEKLICGTVFDPVSGECFTAEAGTGAFLNERKLQTSGTTDIAKSVVAVSFPSRVRADGPELGEFARVTTRCQAIRRTGSAALNLAYVTAGRFDAYWGGNTHAWDVAAGALLLMEAGGVISGPAGEPFRPENPRFVAAATPLLHAEMLRLVKG